MNSSQEITLNRVLKKLDESEKLLQELLNDAWDPMKESERDNIEGALALIKKASYCLYT